MRKKIFVCVIGLLVLLTISGVWTGIGRMSDKELLNHDGHYRTKISDLADFPKWLEEGLGWRGLLLKLYSGVIYGIFNQSTNEINVQVGKEDFLFLGDIAHKNFSRQSGLLEYSDQQMNNFRKGMQTFARAFAKEGIPVLFVIAPEKGSVYGEFFPPWSPAGKRTFSKEKLTFMENLTKTIFLEDALLEFKKNDNTPIYYKTDTHWNSLGGFLGYEAVMKALEKLTGKPLDKAAIKKISFDQSRDNWVHDLKRLLGSTKNEEYYTHLELSHNSGKALEVRETTPEKDGFKGNYARNANALNNLTILIIHDSFYIHSRVSYRESFSEIMEIHLSNLKDQNLKNLIQIRKPDYAIVFIVERNLGHFADFNIMQPRLP